MNEPDAYLVETETVNKLRGILHRLYDESKTLNGDERRDLANKMDAVLEGAFFPFHNPK